MDQIYKVTEMLPDNGKKVICYGFKTFCCKEDMDDERDWHQVVFSMDVHKYRLKKEIPDDPEESILEYYEVSENWCLENEEYVHVIGVTEWKNISEPICKHSFTWMPKDDAMCINCGLLRSNLPEKQDS